MQSIRHKNCQKIAFLQNCNRYSKIYTKPFKKRSLKQIEIYDNKALIFLTRNLIFSSDFFMIAKYCPVSFTKTYFMGFQWFTFYINIIKSEPLVNY